MDLFIFALNIIINIAALLMFCMNGDLHESINPSNQGNEHWPIRVQKNHRCELTGLVSVEWEHRTTQSQYASGY